MRGQSQESLARSSDFLEGGRLSQVNQRWSSLNGPSFLTSSPPSFMGFVFCMVQKPWSDFDQEKCTDYSQRHLLCSCSSATQLWEYSNGVRLEPHLGLIGIHNLLPAGRSVSQQCFSISLRKPEVHPEWIHKYTFHSLDPSFHICWLVAQ